MTDRQRLRQPKARPIPTRNGDGKPVATLPGESSLTEPIRAIETADDIAAAMADLTRRCAHMAAAHRHCSDPPLRRWSPDFDGLAKIIVGQQLSTASANAILQRVAAAVPPLDAAGLLAASDTTLRSAGLSAAKIATLRALASAIQSGALTMTALRTANAEGVRSQLTAIRGIGPWTADIYLLFCRGDADGFAPGDLALQLAAQHLMQLPERPSATELAGIAERWRPWRGVAARMLWAYYTAVKSGGIAKATV